MKTFKAIKEEDLLALVVQGDESAFNEIYERYHKLVFFVANQTCRNEADAQDILQETFLTIKDHVKDLRNPKYFRLWVYRIISSKCKNMFQKNKHIVGMSNEDYFNNTVMEERRDRVPQKTSHFQSDKEVLEKFMGELPESQRLVLVMFYMEQFSIHEISLSLQIPEGTVKSRLSTARKFMEVRVKAYEQQEQVPLNFRFVGEGIAVCLLASYKATQVPKLLVPGLLLPKSKSIWSSMQSGIASHWIAATIVSGALVVGGGGALYAHQKNNIVDEKNPHSAFALTDIEATSTFTQITLDDDVVKNAKEGFYVLQLNACCEKDIEEMDVETLLSLKNLYLEMKNNGGAYYQHLVKIGWAKAYEKKVGI